MVLPVFRGEEIKPQAIVCAPINPVTLALPADELEMETLGHPKGRIVVNDPGMYGMETEITKSHREHLPCCLGRPPACAKALFASNDPDPRGLEIVIHLVKTHDPQRFVVLGRIDAENLRIPLAHDFEQCGRHRPAAIAELQPLGVLFLG